MAVADRPQTVDRRGARPPPEPHLATFVPDGGRRSAADGARTRRADAQRGVEIANRALELMLLAIHERAPDQRVRIVGIEPSSLAIVADRALVVALRA